MAHALVLAYTTYIHDGRVKRHAEALARRGDQVDAITLAAGRTGLINGVNVVGLEIPRYRGSSRASYLKSYVNFFVAAARKAVELAHDHPYDIAIVCTMPDAAILAALPLRRAGTKLVLDVHDTMPELYRDKFPGWIGAMGVPIMKLEERLSARLADLVLAVHEPHRQRLVEYGINPDKIKVVLNSPDDRIFVRDGVVHKDPDTFNVVCHGTITHRMGLDLAVRAVGLLRDRIPQLRLLAVGAGDYLSEIRRLVSELNLHDRVVFTDMIPIEELPNLLRTADLGLVPNRESSATHLMLPVKLLEFAMMGIPAIAPRLKTVEYYFGDGAVRFFKPGDINDLAQAIELMYRSPELRRTYAEKARRVVDRISWPNQRGEFYRAIDSVLPRCESSNSANIEKRKAGGVARARMEG
ncbi:MAG TPA: glycosyltransferase family 4 protein [Candidatus Binataceae bacterium]|nr:glycosyltransferase family 4 protein [Candidatus Binataceae bacterium]